MKGGLQPRRNIIHDARHQPPRECYSALCRIRRAVLFIPQGSANSRGPHLASEMWGRSHPTASPRPPKPPAPADNTHSASAPPAAQIPYPSPLHVLPDTRPYSAGSSSDTQSCTATGYPPPPSPQSHPLPSATSGSKPALPSAAKASPAPSAPASTRADPTPAQTTARCNKSPAHQVLNPPDRLLQRRAVEASSSPSVIIISTCFEFFEPFAK